MAPPAWLIDAMNSLLEFRLIEATYKVYTQYFPPPLLYAIIYTTILGITYLKSRSMAALGAASLITGGVFAAVLPGDIQWLGGITAFLGLAAVIYSVIRRR